ncbi:hypothetical protein D9M68_969460 [compost metagenome]
MVGARQGAVAGCLVESEGARFQPLVEASVDRVQLGTGHGPVVQRGLQGGGDGRDFQRTGQVAGDHDQQTVTAVLQ